MKRVSNYDFGKDTDVARKILDNRRAGICIVGIGGISCAALAEHLNASGYCVFGSDDVRSERTERLEGLGIQVSYPNLSLNLSGADLLVYSLAVSEDEPPVSVARSLGIPTVPRAALLGAVMQDFRIRIGVAGSHGKSTTVAMIADA